MAVLAKGGTSSAATTSAASTHPRASRRGTWRGARGGQSPRMVARASSTGITCGGPAGTGSDELLALHEVGEEGPEPGAQVVALDGQLDGCPQVVELVADVVAPVLEDVAVDGLVLEQEGHGVGELG